MSDCNHKMCDICMRRSCRKYVGPLKQFGTVQACAPCIHAAVLWAHQCACKWGGEPPRDFCGYKEGKPQPAASRAHAGEGEGKAVRGNHGDKVRCHKCKADYVVPVPSGEMDTSEFAFAVTQRKDGTVVNPPFLGTIQLVRCNACGHEFALIDSPKSPEHWASLPKWEGGVQ